MTGPEDAPAVPARPDEQAVAEALKWLVAFACIPISGGDRRTLERAEIVRAALAAGPDELTAAAEVEIGKLRKHAEVLGRILDRAWSAVPADVAADDDDLASHIRAALAGARPAVEPDAEHERMDDQVLRERDEATDAADTLAGMVAPSTIVGEHSNTNEPWRNAMDYARGPWGSQEARHGPSCADASIHAALSRAVFEQDAAMQILAAALPGRFPVVEPDEEDDPEVRDVGGVTLLGLARDVAAAVPAASPLPTGTAHQPDGEGGGTGDGMHRALNELRADAGDDGEIVAREQNERGYLWWTATRVYGAKPGRREIRSLPRNPSGAGTSTVRHTEHRVTYADSDAVDLFQDEGSAWHWVDNVLGSAAGARVESRTVETTRTETHWKAEKA